MSTGLYSIGVSGLRAAQLGLLATEHNVTNASTDGYTRQRTVQTTNVPIATGAGSIGQGVNVVTIERMYDQFLSKQVLTTQAKASDLDAYYGQIKKIDNMLADASAGVSPALQNFFNGVQDAANNPALLSARQSMISSAETLVTRFQDLDARLRQIGDEINGKITDTVTSINAYAKQIAELNGQIIVAESAYGQPPNDLLDQRDQLLSSLNKLIKVSSNTNSNGSFNVYIGTGQQLVVGNVANTMTANASSADNSRIVVGLQNPGGSLELPESLVSGGELGGLVRFRSDSLDRVTNELGRAAASLALTVNAQHAQGQDLLGNAQGSAGFVADFFDVSQIGPTVNANTHNTGTGVLQGQLVNPPPVRGVYTLAESGGTFSLTRQTDGAVWSGASMAALQAALPSAEGLNLVGTTVAAGSSVTVYGPKASSGNYLTNLTSSDYQLSYDGAQYTLTRLSDRNQWSNASLANLSAIVSASEGFSFNLSSGAMAAGDKFLIQPTRNGASNLGVSSLIKADPRLVAVADPFRTAATSANSGSGTISAGKTLSGFSIGNVPVGGITLTYSAATNTLSFAGLAAGQQISVTPPGGTATVVNTPATIAYSAGADISVAGMTFVLSGQPNNGDTFTIKRNAAGVADSRNALALGQLQTQTTMAGGTASYQQAYADMVASNGIRTREAKVTGEAQQALTDQAKAVRDSLSAVNLDEEAANMLRYQQAYQASSKLLEVGKVLFDTLLGIS